MDVWVLDFHYRDGVDDRRDTYRTFSSEDAAKLALAERCRDYWRYGGAEELYGDHGAYSTDEVIRIYFRGQGEQGYAIVKTTLDDKLPVY
jgi:hypothetical protein